MPYIRCCVSGAVLKHKTFGLHGHFFFSFLIVGKNNLKIYLQKFADINISSYIYRVIINNNNLKRSKMKNLYYIRNTKTDQNFDTMEMKFYGSNWEPTLEDDKNWLQDMIDEDPEKFENCVVETVEIED